MNKKHLISLSLTLIIVMLFSALGPTTVYADDGTPPDTTTVEAPQTDGETVDEGNTGEQADEASDDQADGDPTEEAATEEPAADKAAATEEVATEEPPVDEAAATEEVATEEPPADEAAATEEVTTEEPPADEAAATEEVATEPPADETGADETAADDPSLMEQLPDNTEVVVVNADGETEPLATEEAAAIVITGDPMWCPSNANPGDAGCTSSFTSLALLLETLQGSPPDGPGTIWIEDSYDSSVNDPTASEFVIDNTTVGNMSINNLTIQGGWDGNTDSNGTISGVSDFSVPITIGSQANPWGGSVTIRNITISDVVGDTGLTVYSGNSVTVEDSEFTNNDIAGANIHAGGDVTVERTKVNDNGSNDWNVVDGDGLLINSGGYVTLVDVEANINQTSGADIVAANDVAVVDSFFNGNLMYTTDFTDFFGYGLKVISDGDISVSGTEANENFLWGAGLDGANVYIVNSVFSRNVSDSVSFIDDTGLVIVSAGEVNLLNVEANENRMMGAEIFANGEVDITNSSFDNNFGTTVDADTGAETYWGCGLQVTGVPVGGVTIGDLQIQNCDPKNLSAGLINLDTVTADGNYLYGADLETGGNVNIFGSSFSGNATPADQVNAEGGLMIKSDGFVFLDTVTANDNRMFGATIDAKNYIDIEDSIFSNNLNGPGLSATSPVYVTLSNVSALDNAGDGAYANTACVNLNNGGAYTSNGGYGLNVANGLVNENSTPTYANNTLGDTNPNPFNPCTSASSASGRNKSNTIVTQQTENQLPSALGQGYTFVAATKVTSQATNLTVELSFPIPAGMEGANLFVMFWDGSQWVEVPGGSVVNGEFVITVTQPGIYVLVSQ